MRQAAWLVFQAVVIVVIAVSAHERNSSAPVGGHLFGAVIFVFALTAFLNSLFGWCGRTVTRLRSRLPKISQSSRDSGGALASCRFTGKLLKQPARRRIG